jgi:hypothetical protein
MLQLRMTAGQYVFMFIRVVCLFLVAVLVPKPALASDLREFRGTEIIVFYEPSLEDAAKKLAVEYAEIKAEIEKKLQWEIGFTPTVVLIRQHEEFQKEAGNNLVTAFAVPSRTMIMIDYSRMQKTPFDLRATLEHELCHLLIHHYITASVPRWLDEGVAQWASGGISDIFLQDGKDILKQSLLSGNLLPLKEISARFPEEPRELLLSYEESRSFVEFIERRYGRQKLIAILHALERDESIEQATYENLSTELWLIEQEWGKSLLKKYSWPSYIADHIYGVLFFAAAVGTLAGYLMFRRRLRNYRDDDEYGPPDEKDDTR